MDSENLGLAILVIIGIIWNGLAKLFEKIRSKRGKQGPAGSPPQPTGQPETILSPHEHVSYIPVEIAAGETEELPPVTRKEDDSALELPVTDHECGTRHRCSGSALRGLRRAIVWSEILAPPVSLREEQERR